ncbi:FAD binding domain-containing protein [Dichotomocladium elegans]|nr:FAD binding domain-containing protein [Dichotomocladium elegans]
MAQEEYDVIVSGAGPVGLFFAYQMLCNGHRVYICDYKSGPTIESRAALLTPRTLEVLAIRGISHHFLKAAVILQGLQVHYKGTPVTKLSVDVSDTTAFPQMTMISQHKSEKILVGLVESLPSGIIHWGTKVTGYKQTDNHVEVTVTSKSRRDNDGSDKEEVIRAKYIIGADGSHSTVRKATEGWTYEGYAVKTKFALADIRLAGKDADQIDFARANMFIDPEGSCGLIPVDVRDGHKYFRFFGNLGPYEVSGEEKHRVTHGLVAKSDESFTLEQLNTLLAKHMASLDVKAIDPSWITIFRINERIANGFRRGRAFLIGDSAHCHSPAGGQGLNMGLQDADNLAWKLSLVLKGQVSDPEQLLDTYTTEREPIVKSTLSKTGGLTKTMFSVGFFAVANIEAIQRTIVNTVMQVLVRLGSDSPLVIPSNTYLIEAGRFIPETTSLRRLAIRDDLELKTLYQILKGISDRFAVIFVATRPASSTPCPWIEDFWRMAAANEKWKGIIRPYVILSSWHVTQNVLPSYADDDAEDAFWTEYNHGNADSVAQKVGLSTYFTSSELKSKNGPPAAMVVIRPDGYVGFTHLIRSAADVEGGLKILDRCLNK